MSARTISHCQGKGSLAHNNREFFTKNINQERTPDNITFKKESLKTAYSHCFGEAVREYNERQTRADRQIGDYYRHHCPQKAKKRQPQIDHFISQFFLI
jgi:hypothetical protein